MNKKTIQFDQQKESNLLQGASAFATKLTKLLKSFEALGLKKEIRIQDLINILDPEKFVRMQVYTNSKELQALPINEDHALAMIKLPQGFHQFTDCLSKIKIILESQYAEYAIFDFYEQSGTSVTVKDSFKDWAKEKASVHCRDSSDEDIFNTCNEINEKLQYLVSKYPGRSFMPLGDHDKTYIFKLARVGHIAEPKIIYQPLTILNN